MDGMQLPSDLSLSTQNSNLSPSGHGSWRNIKSTVVIGDEFLFIIKQSILATRYNNITRYSAKENEASINYMEFTC